MGLWIFATFTSYIIKGLCGFANTMVFTAMLSFGSVNANISPVDLLLGYPANAILTWKNRKSLDPKVFIPLSVLVLAGSIPGSFLLKNVDASAIKVVFGVMIIVLGIEMFLRERHPGKMKNSKIVLAIIGIIAGVLCGLFGVGALLAAYVSRVTDSGSGFKANISMVFLVESTFRIGLYIVLKILTKGIFLQSLALFPFSLLGLWVGMKCSSKMDDRIVKMLIVVLLIISGISLIAMNLK